MRHLSLLSGILLVLLFSSCDKVHLPQGGDGTPPPPPPDGHRTILLEDFTGQACGFCPGAHVSIEELRDLYGDSFIPVAVHVAYQATYGNGHVPNIGTPVAQPYVDAFGEAPKPNGLLNRREVNGQLWIDKDAWATEMEPLLNLPKLMTLDGASTYDSGNGTVSINIEGAPLTDLTGDHNLVIYLVEDHVIAPQLIYPDVHPDYPAGGTIADYDHEHLLRDIVTDPWGEPFFQGAISGETFTHLETFSLSSDYVASNCHIVAYVRNTTTDEVIEAVTFPLSN